MASRSRGAISPFMIIFYLLAVFSFSSLLVKKVSAQDDQAPIENKDLGTGRISSSTNFQEAPALIIHSNWYRSGNNLLVCLVLRLLPETRLTFPSCVGVMQNGKVEILVNDQGNRITPSYVAFNDEERLVGDAAKNQYASNPKRTIFDIK